MADKKSRKDTAKEPKQHLEKNMPRAQKASEQKDTAKKSNLPMIILAIAVIIVIAALILFFHPGGLVATVPFSTFKANSQASPRISITATYSNQSQLANESTCFTSMIQVISGTRQPSTIDFAIIDKQTNVCTYSTTGLGGNVNPITTNSAYCLSKAYSEDGIFLNYSASNYTLITAGRMYVYGNDAYLEKCPIAIELS